MMPRKQSKPRIELMVTDNRLNGSDAKASCSLAERARIIQFNAAAKLNAASRPSGPPIARLVDSGKIGAEELQAAQEIERAFQAIAGSLYLRPQNMDRVDGGQSHQHWPAHLAQAVSQYQDWANFWSIRRKQHLDYTLEIVIAAVIDERQIDAIAQDMGFHARKVTKAIIGGLRDYAARVGWVNGTIAQTWQDAALETFGAKLIRSEPA
jgi:hypothetical protein